MRFSFRSVFLALAASAAAFTAAHAQSQLALDSIPGARFHFSGPVGERVQANVDEWLLRAPESNPGMLEMFRVRDRQPVPRLVPWAGEFVGKYLISAVQAMRMSDDPRLEKEVRNVVTAFIATQADDGYLGPFPKVDRLRKNWDLWGHYHAILALAMWHQQTGDPSALAAARKAADLVCATYLDTGTRVFDAGDHEMNMAILTGMAMLHRITGEPRYLRMALEVEKDWERAGDYLRAGIDGREFYRSPRPRWESLHDLQGLLELWRITGKDHYRHAFEHHWRSIRRWDWRNTGGFSSGEQATGNPYEPTPIETCCTVAWMALTLDYLRLTGDPAAADELEISTLNGGLGAQHPTGRWWTYSTPMEGVREASAHAIVFQARAGTPELNCCSVNGPRVLGMLSEWAIMSGADAVVVNWLGAGEYRAKLKDNAEVKITSNADAWLEGRTELRVESAMEFTLRLRIPLWAREPVLKLNGAPLADVRAGNFHELRRVWQKEDRLEFSSAMPLRAIAGANQMEGRVSLYHGPVLLAYDQAANGFDENAIPAVDLERLDSAKLEQVAGSVLGTWLAVQVPTSTGAPLHLVDFASAGARGTRYQSWLPATNAPPAPAFTTIPPDGGKVPPGKLTFQWRAGGHKDLTGSLVQFSTNPHFTQPFCLLDASEDRLQIDSSQITLPDLTPATRIYWRVITKGKTGKTEAFVPAAWVSIDPAAPAQALPPQVARGPNGEVISHTLRDTAEPKYGTVESLRATGRGPEGTELNGRDQRITYSLAAWPEEGFSVTLRVAIKELPKDHLGQVFSAWTGPSDDPLRIVIDHGKIYARIEGGGGSSTPGADLQVGRWYAVAAVKQGATLTLFLDGKPVGSCSAPLTSGTHTTACALGGNPRYTGNEFLAARFADFALYARALSDK